ncbi:type II secretion system protein GspM [Propionivibrio dicarboxylicus]|uniref:MSHA biogenesis protein MshJ n=1 Tax=Propionivibrio dicarboxylicus TaxID=83767 RepID=A0A1G8IJP3_9RHOO|nr:type II secretion system protein GspM [Propionivibrio dicarboxylicus]SDI19258.1 MSHA biogenesis protein MshJ [Propionivibrio dicarboxylicus]
MKVTLAQLTARFDALSARERGLVAAALLGSVAFIFWVVLIDPQMLRRRMAEQSVAVQRGQIEMLRAQVAALASPTQSPEAIARREIESLKKQVGETGERLATLENALVTPQRMSRLLESMIGGRSNLRLLSLRTLPVMPVLEKKDGGGKPGATQADQRKTQSVGEKASAIAETGGLFKHGVELQMEGGYSDITEYLERLEQLPQKLLWSSFSLSGEKYPKVVLKLTVFTLSMDRTWMTF